MRLSELTDSSSGLPDVDIAGLSADSRAVRPGWLFAALPGSRLDGSKFIDDALHNGAVAILAHEGVDVQGGVVLHDDNPRRCFALMAARFYGRQPETIVAVTGTNGKSSVVEFTRQLWTLMGEQAASLGTLGVRGASDICSASMTTPDPASLHAVLADMAVSGIDHLAMEASSHGLDQYRLDGVKIKAAAFTNLSRDHLDYHADMDSYLAAKARLFSEVLAQDGTAILNADVETFEPLSAICEKRGLRVLSYGTKGKDIRLCERTVLPEGQKLSLEILGNACEITLPLIGEFQAMNALCALGLVLAENPDADISLLEKLRGAPGRLQLVPGHPKGAAVYVDYAHTPDALENVLRAVRPHVRGKLYGLIGCGGDRDTGKRPIMGRIASELADVAVITDDNPRSEDPAAIRAQMMEGASAAAKEIGGRAQAIEWAVRELSEGDVLVIAGKGHETGQIVGDAVLPFNDVEQAQKAIAEMK